MQVAPTLAASFHTSQHRDSFFLFPFSVDSYTSMKHLDSACNCKPSSRSIFHAHADAAFDDDRNRKSVKDGNIARRMKMIHALASEF